MARIKQVAEHATQPMALPEPDSAEAPGVSSDRKWRKAELSGSHQHFAGDRIGVTICERRGQFLARGRYLGRQFAKTLGATESEATAKLRRLLVDLEEGTFVPPGQARRSVIARRRVPDHTLRTLIDEFLTEKRRTNGPDTAITYRSRLAHALDFAELKAQSKRYRLAASLDREFVISFKAYLFRTEVTRNGRASEQTSLMSPKTVRLCLEALRALLGWARNPTVAKLPADFVQPVDNELLGPQLKKDPLRANPLPLEVRVRIVELMDEWQLIHLSGLLYLPTRPEDVSGATIGDFDLDQRIWRLGHRFGGNDFSKGKTSSQMPLPAIGTSLLQLAAAGRPDGPMFRDRRSWEGRRGRLRFDSPAEFGEHLQEALRRAAPPDIEAVQGRKKLVRRLLRQAGAVSCDQIRHELRRLFDQAGVPRSITTYQVRHAATTDLLSAGVTEPMRNYLTMHATSGILSTYTSLQLRQEADRYFQFISPLLRAIEVRSQELHLS